jgi:hypothetical protein
MGKVTALDVNNVLKGARELEVFRGSQLLVAAQNFMHGDMDEEDFMGVVCQYVAACDERIELMQQIKHANNALN